MFDNWPIPLVIAHRGASGFAPENTLSAFELAINHLADVIEFDVKLTSDREVVVIHDATVNRTTEGCGKVAEFSLADIKRLDAGKKFNESFRGEKVPTLREIFDQLGNRVKINIELTNYSTPNDGLVGEVVKLIREFKLEETVMFSSFFPWNLKKAKELIPEIPSGLLAFPGWLGILAKKSFSNRTYQAFHPNKSDFNNQIVSDWHNREKRIHVWTVNDEEEMRRFLQMGVDGIFTDDPGLLRSILRKE